MVIRENENQIDFELFSSESLSVFLDFERIIDEQPLDLTLLSVEFSARQGPNESQVFDSTYISITDAVNGVVSLSIPQSVIASALPTTDDDSVTLFYEVRLFLAAQRDATIAAPVTGRILIKRGL